MTFDGFFSKGTVNPSADDYWPRLGEPRCTWGREAEVGGGRAISTWGNAGWSSRYREMTWWWRRRAVAGTSEAFQLEIQPTCRQSGFGVYAGIPHINLTLQRGRSTDTSTWNSHRIPLMQLKSILRTALDLILGWTIQDLVNLPANFHEWRKRLCNPYAGVEWLDELDDQRQASILSTPPIALNPCSDGESPRPASFRPRGIFQNVQ